MRVTAIFFAVAFAAAGASAHVAPISPSTCAATIGLAVPGAGISASVDPPGPSDQLRVVYDPEANPASSRAQVCPADAVDPHGRCGAIVPRAFTIGAASGTIAFPGNFALRLLASGEIDGTAIPLAVTFDGSAATLALDVTSGVADVAGTLAVGAPIDASGRMTLIGTASGATLALPLGGAQLLFTVACTLDPVPDLDQFAVAPRIEKIAGTLSSKRTRVSLVLASETTLPGDFTTAPATLQLGANDAPIMALHVLGGLTPGRRGTFGGESGDGTSLTVHKLRRKGAVAYRLDVRGHGSPPPFTAGATEVLVDAGGLLARSAVVVRPNAARTHARVRLP